MSQSRFQLRGTMLVALALLLGFIGFATANQPSAQAATYSVYKTTSMTKTAYHRASSKGAVYNELHTKKLANLSSYPNTTWYATKEVILKHGSTKAVYYKVTNGAKTVTGYIWHSYLTKGKAPFTLSVAKAAVAMDEKNGESALVKECQHPSRHCLCFQADDAISSGTKSCQHQRNLEF